MTEKSKTICSYCEKIIDDTGKNVGDFISHCGRFSVVGNYKDLKGGKMEETKDNIKIEKENKFGKSYYIKCNGCKESKFAREEIYKNRIKKFGSEEKMLANYLCRDCRHKKVEQDIPA